MLFTGLALVPLSNCGGTNLVGLFFRGGQPLVRVLWHPRFSSSIVTAVLSSNGAGCFGWIQSCRTYSLGVGLPQLRGTYEWVLSSVSTIQQCVRSYINNPHHHHSGWRWSFWIVSSFSTTMAWNKDNHNNNSSWRLTEWRIGIIPHDTTITGGSTTILCFRTRSWRRHAPK